jgi:hypothetical protein
MCFRVPSVVVLRSGTRAVGDEQVEQNGRDEVGGAARPRLIQEDLEHLGVQVHRLEMDPLAPCLLGLKDHLLNRTETRLMVTAIHGRTGLWGCASGECMAFGTTLCALLRGR